MDTGPWRVWVVLVAVAVGMVAAVAECWLQASFVGWVTAVGVLLTLLVVVLGYDLPGRYLLPHPFGWTIVALGLAGVVSVVRLPGLQWPHVSSMAMGAVVVTFVVLAFVLWGLHEPAKADVAGPLIFPLPMGRWVVATGGVAVMNHHLLSDNQSGAVDLVALRANGARASGIAPRQLAAYEAYGSKVASPCDGVVVAAHDGRPERLGVRGSGSDPYGNHVSIDNGHEILLLAHLRPGSVRVAAGDRVVAGQPVGEVGCSGRTREPNLHVHAERDGEGLRLSFVDIDVRRLRPGRRLRVTEEARSVPYGDERE